MYGGYAGSILEIDLSTRSLTRIPMSSKYKKQLLGGKALAAQLLCECMSGKETAFSDENRVVIAAAPLTGTGAPGSARVDIASLSAKDDLPAFSNCGGDFGVLLKKAGYDALVIRGRCTSPSILEITDESVTFHDAEELWGMGSGECIQNLHEQKKNRSISVISIGPAGENLVKFASVSVEGHSTGRAGFGAVFGWKNLKAITVTGSGRIPLADSTAVSEQNRQWYAMMRDMAQDTAGVEYCRGCPLHCAIHGRGTDALLDELGMDSVEAENARRWAVEQGIDTSDLYENIAYRRGVGDALADGIAAGAKKSGKRRGGKQQQIAAAFNLPPNEERTASFCRNYSEAVSVCGQCMFTVGALQAGKNYTPLPKLLESVTGQEMNLERLISLGEQSFRLEEELCRRFEK